MTSLRERLYTSCPFAKAPSFLNYYLEQLARNGGAEGAIMRLEVPLSTFGVPSNLNIGRNVIARFAPPGEMYGRQRPPSPGNLKRAARSRRSTVF